jgi:hypothetical protein
LGVNKQCTATNERGDKEGKKMSKTKTKIFTVGDDVLVDICPCPEGDAETWMQIGRLLSVCQVTDRGEPRVLGVVEITRAMTEDENQGRYQSTDEWNGCRFVVHFVPACGDWRASFPANARAEELWREDLTNHLGHNRQAASREALAGYESTLSREAALMRIADVAAGEIAKFEVELDGEKTGIFMAARVVANSDDFVQLNPADVPRAILKQNLEAISALLENKDAGLTSQEEN